MSTINGFILLAIATNLYYGSSYVLNNECECVVSVLSSSGTFPQGHSWSGAGVTSDTTDPLGPWTGDSVLYRGTTNGGQSVVYEYRIDCNKPCWITNVTLEGIAFQNSQFTLYNGDTSGIIDTLSVSSPNEFATHIMDMSSNEFYTTSFRFIETNSICCVRYRSFITMSMTAAATPTPTSPTLPPTPPTQAPTFAEIPKTACDCNISIASAATTYGAGSGFLNITSSLSDPMGPWFYEGVLFKGTNDPANVDQIVYDYAIDCVRSCWITTITIKGAAFFNTQFSLYNADKSVMIDTLSANTPNEFATHTMDIHEYYGNSFRFVEENNICCTRYRSSISMTVSLEPTSDPTMDPTLLPTVDPTSYPSSDPTVAPTKGPETEPTNTPTKEPTQQPTREPTREPTSYPSADPTKDPTNEPTSTTEATSTSYVSTSDSTINLTQDPTEDPTSDPTSDPTKDPTLNPTPKPTPYPIGYETTYTSFPNTTSASTEELSSTQSITSSSGNDNINNNNDGQIQDDTGTTETQTVSGRDGEEASVLSKADGFDQNVMIIIIVCSIILICCILVIVFMKRRKAAKTDQANLAKDIPASTAGQTATGFNTTNTMSGIASASTSPKSMESNTFNANQGNLMNFVGVNDMMMDDVVNEMESCKTPGYDGNETQIIIGETELMEGGVNNVDNKAHLSDFEIEMEEIVTTPNGYDVNHIDEIIDNNQCHETPNGMEMGQDMDNQNIANDEFIIDDDGYDMEEVVRTPKGHDNDNDDDLDLTDITPM